MMRHRVITKHREHTNVIFRLTDAGKSDAHVLRSTGVARGTIEDTLRAVARLVNSSLAAKRGCSVAAEEANVFIAQVEDGPGA